MRTSRQHGGRSLPAALDVLSARDVEKLCTGTGSTGYLEAVGKGMFICGVRTRGGQMSPMNKKR